MKAMILAAGLGTRLKPLTESKPKALVEIKGRTLLEHNIEKLSSFGIKEIIVNVHHFSDKVISFLENKKFGGDVRIIISDETSQILDTGGAVKKASKYFESEPFILHNVDIISNINLAGLVESHINSNSIATLAVRNRESSRYLLFDEDRMCGWENIRTGEKKIKCEKNSLKRLAYSGIQIIDPKLFHYFPDENVFSIIDLYISICDKEKISGFCHDEDYWFDLGTVEKLKLAEKYI
ncbi:MAG: nucleotidyltransferase family protein [Melioribacteraceae bacterium]|nr:nucleotidyltransferase family protein [Melioribacteraceae bacterium]MCF8353239.1 nucleotidyltransferase family protein [Melioribacteraceae bacterium]MCF8393971.1 nucleotidyltransferase family protein [Melioribacteraceae bacterium]MCF8418727.1 nucleotidyltransferase family protein [Melioribacteraceae bacterium]